MKNNQSRTIIKREQDLRGNQAATNIHYGAAWIQGNWAKVRKWKVDFFLLKNKNLRVFFVVFG